MGKGKPFEKEACTELFARQFGLVIIRRRAELELLKTKEAAESATALNRLINHD